MTRGLLVAGGRLLLLLVFATAAVRLVPALWPQLFPAPGPSQREAPGAPLGEAEVVSVLQRLVAARGGSVAEGGEVQLGEAESPPDLQGELRIALGDRAEVYVHPDGPLAWRLRVYSGGEPVWVGPVLPWLPERPQLGHRSPALALLMDAPRADDAALRDLLRWKAPLAVALGPDDPEALRAGRRVLEANKELWVRVDDAEQPLGEQLDAFPNASGVLLALRPEASWASGWRAELAARGMGAVLLWSGAPEPRPGDAAWPGDTAVDRPDRWARLRARALQRGGGALVFGPDDLAAVEEFIGTAREDGYRLVFPGELTGSVVR